jgi:hypothetical protein
VEELVEPKLSMVQAFEAAYGFVWQYSLRVPQSEGWTYDSRTNLSPPGC